MVRRAVCLLLAVSLLPAATAGAETLPPLQDGNGLHVTKVEQLTPRLYAFTLTTDLLLAPTNVRVLLPDGYDAHPQRRYPVLYLFHGTSGGAADWTNLGDAEATTAGRDLIVVMPDAGVNSDGGGWFTDWVNGGRYGPPKWETYHVGHLVPWIDANLRTVRNRSGRAIAGLSQGGFGAGSYAARHPDVFSVMASFSGALDIAANGAIADPLVTPVVNATETFLDRVPPNTFFGDRLTNELNWAAHDPATLAGNLRATRLHVYTGDGRQGPLDPPGPNPAGAGIEAGVHTLSALFHGEVLERGIPIDYRDYGPGTHIWPYWARDLRDVIGPLMRELSARASTPAQVEYMSADPHWRQWGWTVAIDRPAAEFSRLEQAGRGGFTLAGSGTGSVVTPRFYTPGATATVTLRGPLVDRTVTRRVGARGRLRLRVPLGPGNRAKQFTPGAMTRVHSTRVTVKAPIRQALRR